MIGDSCGYRHGDHDHANDYNTENCEGGSDDDRVIAVVMTMTAVVLEMMLHRRKERGDYATRWIITLTRLSSSSSSSYVDRPHH